MNAKKLAALLKELGGPPLAAGKVAGGGMEDVPGQGMDELVSLLDGRGTRFALAELQEPLRRCLRIGEI